MAVRTSVSEVVTEETAAEKLALLAPAGTVMIPGTETAPPLLAMLTLSPPVGAAPVRFTEHESVPAALKLEVVQLNEARLTAVETPVPESRM